MLLGGSGGGHSSSATTSTPQIKNHSVTHHRGYLYQFGGYDGRRNHQTLLIFSLKDRRWITPSLSSGSLIMDENGAGHEDDYHDGGGNVSGFHYHPFDHRRNNNNNSSNNNSSNSAQYYTVRGVPPPGRNGHTATLAITTRRRRLRRQQHLQQQHHHHHQHQSQQHCGEAMLVDQPLQPRSNDGDYPDIDNDHILLKNTVAEGEGDDHNGNLKSNSDESLFDSYRETTQQHPKQEQHIQQHPWRSQNHLFSKANGLGDLSFANEEAHAVVDVMNTKMCAIADASTPESNLDVCRERTDEVVGNEADYGTDHVIDNIINHHRVKQQENVVNDDTSDVNGSSSNHYRHNPNRGDASSFVIANNHNPMEDNDVDSNDNDEDDEYDAQIIIIGGWLGAGPLAASDMWVLDISGGLERLRWFQPVS